MLGMAGTLQGGFYEGGKILFFERVIESSIGQRAALSQRSREAFAYYSPGIRSNEASTCRLPMRHAALC